MILLGLVIWLAGKITKVKILETVGKIMVAVGVIVWGLGFAGIHIPLPI